MSTASGIRVHPERNEDTWSATQVGVTEPRQNGKSRILLARTVAGILHLEEPKIIHSAHEVKTAMEQYNLLKDLCLNYDVLSKRVKRVISVNGKEGIQFKKTEVAYMARTKGSGRGFSASTILLDEAQELSFMILAAILPTLSAVPNSQLWLAGTPPSPEMNGEVFTRFRAQALKGMNPRRAWIEWGSGPERGEEASYDYTDVDNWLRANPACPERISLEAIRDEFDAMDEDTFRRERLGEWAGEEGLTVIPITPWEEASDPEAKIVKDMSVSIDTNPSRSTTSVCLAGRRPDGRRHVQLLAQGPGTDWVGKYVHDLVHSDLPIRAVVIDAGSPAASLVEALRLRFQVKVTVTQVRHMAMACGQAYDGFVGKSITHDGKEALSAAMIGSAKRDLLDAWGLSRKRAEVDISAFVAAVLALYGVDYKKVTRPRVGVRGERKA